MVRHAARAGFAFVLLFVAATAATGLLAAGAAGAAEQKRHGIRIIEATYGGNCAGVKKGNVTTFVAAACNDEKLCNYRIYYKDMGGDPAAGCAKAFSLSYTCAGSGKRERCNVAAEAGWGGEDGKANEFCLLACSTPRPAPAREGDKGFAPR
jgi:hypothetical protein